MYLGIDVHKRYAQVAVMDDAGEIVEEVRVENATLDDLAQRYAGAEAVIEATSNYYHIHDTLSEYLDVTVAHPKELNQIADTDKKTDRVDAKRLAQMLRTDMLAESYVPGEEIRTLRDLVRTRKALVEERTAEKNRVRAVLKRTDNAYDSALFGPTGRAYLAELSLSEADRLNVEAHLAVIEGYDQQIDRLEDEIEAAVLESEAAQLLLSVPGVGQSTAALVVAEVGEIGRFDRHEELVSYAGLDPMVHQSGDTEVHGSISKEGSAPLRWALVQAAHVSVRYDEYLGNFYTRLKERKNHQIAIVATARKLLVPMFYMLDRRELYDPPEVSA